MARVAKPLTHTEIKQARPRDKEYSLWDGSGLYLRIKPNGAKSWLLMYYRPFTRKRANLSLGTYPAVSLAAARKSRQDCLELLAKDIDPGEHRKEEKRLQKEAHDNTLHRVASRWFEIKKSKVSPNYAEDIWRSLESHIFPDLGKLPVSRIRARHVIEILEPLAARGALETVKRLCQRLNEIMTYAVNTDLLDANPLSGVNKAFQPPKKNNMATLKPEELPSLMASIANASIKITTRCLIEWQLHTMARPGEAAGARWEEIDEETALWVIPAERMKKNRSHTVPLSPQALALLAIMKPLSRHREYIFPAERNPRTHIHQQTANMALKRMGFEGRLVAHGLRSLASTTLNEQGFDPDLIEAALAHTDKNDVRAAYNRAEYVERRRPMMVWWSEHIEQAAEGNVSLTRRKHLTAV